MLDSLLTVKDTIVMTACPHYVRVGNAIIDLE